ncbi:MAG: FAD-dependent oxidoreductase, partial [Chlamydiae bacterium]|nr:FAD-dependent oxidoreductase [Chlamydiota bacterium]
MEELVVDYAVIGSGPAGQKAAIQAAKLGKKVVILERDSVLGGASLNSGTIPSKSLREAILDLTDFYERSFYAQNERKTRVSINDLNFRLNKVLEEQRKALLRQFEKNHIGIVTGLARFENPHHLLVLEEKSSGEDTHKQYRPFLRIQFSRCLIATGSKPRNPIHVPFDSKRVLDSTRLLSIDHVPSTLIVLGGGIIGAEYASFFAALGTEVTVVDKRTHLLPLLDLEIGMHLQKALSSLGLKM